MNFIEEIFGIAPDGGDGTTEMMFVLAFAVVVVVVSWRVFSRRWSRKARS